jgi:hypothetical protein
MLHRRGYECFMRDDYAAQFLVGASTAAVSAIFNLALTGNVNWFWVLVAFGVPFVVLRAYQQVGLSLPRVWRVRDNELLSRAGQPLGSGAWELNAGERTDWAIYGPRKPLGHGRYRATFRLKINSIAGDEPAVDLDVASRHGKKVVALRTVTVQDFRRADTYQDFALDFYLLQDDNEIEFRVSTRGAPRRVVLERVMLARRL